MKILLLLVSLIFCAPNYPDKTGPINDFANVLSPKTEDALAAVSEELLAKTGFAFVVVTINPEEEVSVEEYSNVLYEKWGIGKKGTDEGTLLIFMPEQKQMRFEVGYGSEGYLTDALTSSIINQKMIPEVKAGNIERSIIIGSVALVSSAATHFGVQITGVQKQRSHGRSQQKIPLPLLIVGVIVFIAMASTSTGRAMLLGMLLSRATGGGGFGGSNAFGGRIGGGGFGGGFGGGMSGGGGASGRW
ncbi:MAG: TPM domain-containing protein [Fibrobacteres bacterium]|nr:TPM domain-containing protein [Fibrobacterota bacterium]